MSENLFLGSGLTLADQHCAALDFKMVILSAKAWPPAERRSLLETWSYCGPHKSGIVKLSSDAVEEALAWCDREASNV